MTSLIRTSILPPSLKAKIGIAFLGILLVSFALVIFSLLLQGNLSVALNNPSVWVSSLNESTAISIVSSISQILAAVLAIAVTVVAIIVELAANRYSHRITTLFVREPVNIVVMSFFVIATIVSIWVSITLNTGMSSSRFVNGGLLVCLVLATGAFGMLLPYFAFVMTFLSPVTVISKIKNNALLAVSSLDNQSITRSQAKFLDAVDDLQDIARRSSELSDRAVEMASVNAMFDLVLSYQACIKDIEQTLPAWFDISNTVIKDPDFVSINQTSLDQIASQKTWVEVKIMRQYLDLVSDSNISSRDTSYLIAINTKRIAIESLKYRQGAELIQLCLRCYNSFIRATINHKDARTGYYIMDQYRMLAEDLLKKGKPAIVREIANHLQFYGLLGFKLNMIFLIEVAAEDISHLAGEAIGHDEILLDDLIALLLELDQEIKSRCQEENLLGVRRAQVKLAARLMSVGDNDRAQKICADIKTETPERKQLLIGLLQSENKKEYWEFTDRGINFAYLPPEQKEHLGTIADMID